MFTLCIALVTESHEPFLQAMHLFGALGFGFAAQGFGFGVLGFRVSDFDLDLQYSVKGYNTRDAARLSSHTFGRMQGQESSLIAGVNAPLPCTSFMLGGSNDFCQSGQFCPRATRSSGTWTSAVGYEYFASADPDLQNLWTLTLPYTAKS